MSEGGLDPAATEGHGSISLLDPTSWLVLSGCGATGPPPLPQQTPHTEAVSCPRGWRVGSPGLLSPAESRLRSGLRLLGSQPGILFSRDFCTGAWDSAWEGSGLR